MSKKPKSKWEKLADEVEHDEQELLNDDAGQTEESPETLTQETSEQLEGELNEIEEKYNQATNQVLRLQAELANLQKRGQRDVENAHKYGTEKLVQDLLPVIDSLEKGLEIEIGDNDFAKNIHAGMELTASMLQKTLEKYGVEVVNPAGDTFNPDYHEAMSMQENADFESNTVITVFQKGYTLNKRLVRPALVVVAK